MTNILALALPIPLYQTFDYLCDKNIAVGTRVQVNFNHKSVIAIVVALKTESKFKLKNIEKIIDEEPIIDEKSLQLVVWSAKYFQQPIGEMLFASLPKKLRLGKDLIIKKPLKKHKLLKNNIVTNNEQQQAIDKILLSQNNYQAFLLHGITGSGKTEVYLQIAKQILANNKQVLMLVPEIGLTPQMVKRLATRLNTKIAIIHSGLNITQKLDNYLSAKNLDAMVVLGTRSAIWTQMPNLGLIIIDEEHDCSFKQQSSPRYNAKNVAFMRSKNNNIPLVLGSATPSLESLKNVLDKKLIHLVMKNRATGIKLPKVTIADTRADTMILSTQLQQKIKQHLANNKQILLFINRRGYAPIYYCTSCNWQFICESCDKQMVYHRSIHKLKCHSCGKISQPPEICGNCQAPTMQVLGYGTQRLEENLSASFPEINVIRIDRDSTSNKSKLKQKLKQIESGETCIIVGTQMLAKGHDFSNITLVGVLDTDGSLLSSNFRSLEYLSQLLVQVSGRAGRAKDSGEVIIQTNYPDHPVFQFAKNSDYTGFAKKILIERKNSIMPPFASHSIICANSKKPESAKSFLQNCKQIFNNIQLDEINISPVIEANIRKKADYYYFNILLYSTNRGKLNSLIQTFLQNLPKAMSDVRWFIDVDPLE